MKVFFKHIMFFLLMLIVSSCLNKSIIDNNREDNTSGMDLMPLSIEFEIIDKQGNNLLDKDTKGNWLNEMIECFMDGEKYSYPASKLYPCSFYGLKVVEKGKYSYDGGGWGPHLRFGDFESWKNRHTTIIFNWPDKTTDNLELIIKYDNKNNREENYVLLKLNGQETSLCVPLVKTGI